MIDLRQIRRFVAVAEELHFGRAARRLGLSQPPLSMEIRALEREVGAALFTRTQRKVELTTAGATLLGEARRLLAQAEMAVTQTRRAARGEVGRLAIGFVSTADYSLLPPLIRRFRARQPDIALTLTEATGDRQLALLAAGELDLGLMIGAVAHGDLASRPVYREALIVALPIAHRLARRRATGLARRHAPVEAAALADDGLILFPRPLAPTLHDRVIGVCQQAGFTPRIAQEAVQMQTILGLVAAGLGIALVPACMANLRRAGVVYARLRRPGAAIETCAVWRRDEASPVLAALLAELPAVASKSQRATIR